MQMENSNKKYIGYYRLSCKHALKGENTSLGIEAQKTAVRNFVAQHGGELISEHVEIESGKNNDRKILSQCINEAEKLGATLILSKLDRLSREVSFLFQLKSRIDRTGIKIKCLDMPNLDTLTLGIFATIAQNERETISKRTKVALQELAKTRKLGNGGCYLTNDDRIKGHDTIKANARNNDRNRQASAMIVSLRNSGLAFQKIADKLNELNFRTRNDRNFTSTAVKILSDRYFSEIAA